MYTNNLIYFFIDPVSGCLNMCIRIFGCVWTQSEGMHVSAPFVAARFSVLLHRPNPVDYPARDPK